MIEICYVGGISDVGDFMVTKQLIGEDVIFRDWVRVTEGRVVKNNSSGRFYSIIVIMEVILMNRVIVFRDINVKVLMVHLDKNN